MTEHQKCPPAIRLAETLARKKIEFRDLEIQMERLERDRHALILQQKQENDWLERRKLARKRKLTLSLKAFLPTTRRGSAGDAGKGLPVRCKQVTIRGIAKARRRFYLLWLA